MTKWQDSSAADAFVVSENYFSYHALLNDAPAAATDSLMQLFLQLDQLLASLRDCRPLMYQGIASVDQLQLLPCEGLPTTTRPVSISTPQPVHCPIPCPLACPASTLDVLPRPHVPSGLLPHAALLLQEPGGVDPRADDRGAPCGLCTPTDPAPPECG